MCAGRSKRRSGLLTGQQVRGRGREQGRGREREGERRGEEETPLSHEDSMQVRVGVGVKGPPNRLSGGYGVRDEMGRERVGEWERERERGGRG